MVLQITCFTVQIFVDMHPNTLFPSPSPPRPFCTFPLLILTTGTVLILAKAPCLSYSMMKDYIWMHFLPAYIYVNIFVLIVFHLCDNIYFVVIDFLELKINVKLGHFLIGF